MRDSFSDAMRACPQCYASYDGELEYCGLDGTRLIETDRDLLIGCEIDRYLITDLLGRGAMGAVYRARHTSLGRDFALKVLSGAFAANPGGLARFHREADAMAKIRHSNIVNVVDFVSTPQGLNVLIMDYLPGRTLHEAIRSEGPFSPERAGRIARQIASGLAAAHALELVHRDVKPSNVLLVHESREEVVKLLDFGVVTLEKQDDLAERLTGAGRVVGTPTYMAPEQAREGPINFAADLYSLGVVLYEMLAGRPPFDAKTVAEILVQHAIDTPPPLPACRGIDAIAFRLLAKHPVDRYPSALAVVEAIDQTLAGVTPAPTPVEFAALTRAASGITPPPVQPRPSRWPIALGALALVAGLAIFGWSQSNAEPPVLITNIPEEPATATVALVAAADDVAAAVDVNEEVPEAPATKKTPRVRKTRSARATPVASSDGPATAPALHKRLDAIMTTLRGATREIPSNLAKECDNDYLALRIAVNDAKNEEALRNVRKRIHHLERRIESLRRGERTPH